MCEIKDTVGIKKHNSYFYSIIIEKFLLNNIKNIFN